MPKIFFQPVTQVPFFGSSHFGIHDKIEGALRNILDSRNSADIKWDQLSAKIGVTLFSISRKSARRRRRRVRQLRSSLRSNARTRKHLVTAIAEAIHKSHRVRQGRRLHRKEEDLRWLYKNTSVREKDQTVSQIIVPNGSEVHPGTTIPDNFAIVWRRILGVEHREVLLSDLERKVAELFTISNTRQVSAEQNKILLAQIVESEILAAIKRLDRCKAAGSDGLNNDYFERVCRNTESNVDKSI